MAFDVLLNPSQGTDVQFFLARGKRIINHNNFGICHFLRPPTRRLVGISSKPADFFPTVLSRLEFQGCFVCWHVLTLQRSFEVNFIALHIIIFFLLSKRKLPFS